MKRAPAPKQPAAAPAKSSAAPAFSWNRIGLLMAILAAALYVNTLGHDYTVDDGTVIANNKYTKQGTAALGKIFTLPYRAGFWDRKEGLYRPLSVAMFAIEYQLVGEKPWLGHLINVLLFAITAVVLLNVMRSLLRKHHPLIPVLATLLFIFHPIHTEVVANIKSRDEILSLLFGLLSLQLLLRYADEHKLWQMLTAVFVYFLCMLSKESGVTWMGVFPLAVWCTRDVDLKKTIVLSAPFLAVVLVFLLIRQQVLGTFGSNYELMLINNSLVGATDTGSRVASAIYILGKYLWLLFVPVTLVFDYSYNTVPLVGFSDIRALVSLIVVLGLIGYALTQLKKRNTLALAILFFFGTISLVSNIFFLIEATMAERFLYTPSLGFCMAILLMFSSRFKEKKNTLELTATDVRENKTIVSVFVIVFLLFGAKTIARNGNWKNNLTLLSVDVKSNPESARIRYAYGSAILVEEALKEKDSNKKNAQLDEAINQLLKGVSIIANYNDAWYNLGVAYKEKNDAKSAVAAFEQARSYKPFKTADRYSDAGVAYGMLGQYDKALADLKQSVTLDPSSADAWNNYGLYLSEAGKHDEALAAFDKAFALRKDFDKAFYNRGNAWAKVNQFRKAMEDYAKALSINPSYSDAYNNTGNCYGAMNMPDSALVWFIKAERADPSNTKALLNIAITYKIKGDEAQAQAYIAKAKSYGATF